MIDSEHAWRWRIGALLFPLEVQLPRGVLAVFAASPVLAGLCLFASVTLRPTGIVLPLAWATAMTYLVVVSRHRQFLLSKEVAETQEK